MISIIMPTYNRAYIIEQAIESILVQTYKDWELIIVDDASTDTTEQVVSKYLCSKIRYYVNNENKGANYSRNFGADCAKGEVLTFLDSDNYWPETRLEIQYERFKRYESKNCFLYGKVQIENENSKSIVPEIMPTVEELKQIEIRKNIVDTNTIMIKKSLFWELGGFDINIPRLQDWEFVLRLMYDYNVEGIGCNEILSFGEIQENSIGKDETKFWIAMGMLYQKILYKYQSEKEVISFLMRISSEEKISREWKNEVIRRICFENSQLMISLLKELETAKERLSNRHGMEKLLYEWHKKNICSQNGTLFSEYFYEKSEIQTIAIYGLGKLGELFYDEIKTLPVKVVYGIDKTKEEFGILPIKRPEDIFETVDRIVVTVLNECDQIKAELEKKTTCQVVTLVELIHRAGAE